MYACMYWCQKENILQFAYIGVITMHMILALSCIIRKFYTLQSEKWRDKSRKYSSVWLFDSETTGQCRSLLPNRLPNTVIIVT